MVLDLLIRLILFLGGLACIACEVWGTYDFLWEKYGRWNYLVAGGLVLTSLAAILPMGAEYAHRKGMRALKWAAWIAVPVALAFVFTVSIQPTGTATDNDETQRKQIAEAIKIARAEQREAEDQLVTDKATVARNCDVWGPKCDKAKTAQAATEKKLAGARAVLKTHGVEIDDSMAKRIVAYLPFLTREQVLLYQPLLLPMGLAIIGSLLIAIAVRGGKPLQPGPGLWARWRTLPVKVIVAPPPQQQATITPVARQITVPMRSIAAPMATVDTELDPKPVVTFMKRKLLAARGVNSDLADIYEGFLQDWHAKGCQGDPLTAAQFGSVLKYICKEAGIRLERRGKKVVCIDRKLVA